MRRSVFCHGTSVVPPGAAAAATPAELRPKDSPIRTSGTVAAAVFINLRRSMVTMTSVAIVKCEQYLKTQARPRYFP
jgi:hypothetical protein